MTFTWTTFAAKRDLKELERDIKAMEVALKRDLVDVEMRLPHKIEWLRADTARQIPETNHLSPKRNRTLHAGSLARVFCKPV